MIRSAAMKRSPFRSTTVFSWKRSFPSSLSCSKSLSTTTTTTSYSFSTYVASSSDDRPFEKVLIANRGEIACRVIRTCQSLGIPTVALYSVADGPNCLHASMADERYQIGTGPHPTESYLLHDQVLDIAQRSGAQAIHPGYGFLSENATFCKSVADTPGLTFVGPGVEAITAMGSKSKSKAIMEDAGVPITPGYYENVVTVEDSSSSSSFSSHSSSSPPQDPELLLNEAIKIGFPLLIKAVMGGGGKGMRLVWSEQEFLEKLEACQRESLNSFGDARVLLEKYLIKPRHVEVQVVADDHGNVVHLYERDCSLQRRHQKIIEEAPASDLPPALRERFGEMGKRVAEAVGYVNAGTVEFLLDTQDPGQFYFCEMNTRLQVEHPITEMVTGIDLVEWQLRVAAGEELPIRNQDDIPCYGHAFEARIYAENPAKQFLPATGQVWHHRPPAIPNGEGVTPTGGVRVDTGIQVGQDVGVYYDPMVCKLIVHDESREASLQKLVTALKQYQIAGVPTNIDFLIKCAQHKGFQEAGGVNTGFLEDYMDVILPPMEATEMDFAPSSLSSPLSSAVGVFITMLQIEGRIGISDLETERRRQISPWNSLSGSWRLGMLSQRTLQLNDGRTVTCTSLKDGSFEISIPSSTAIDNAHNYDDDANELDQSTVFHLNGSLTSDGRLDIVVDHTRRITGTASLYEKKTGDGNSSNNSSIFHICVWPESPELFHSDDDYVWNIYVDNPLSVSASDQHHGSTGGGSSSRGTIKAPMPGKISRINVSIGDTVEVGETLMLMEAMKMEHPIVSPVAGTLTALPFDVNDIVSDGIVLATVENLDDYEDDGEGEDGDNAA